MRQRVMMAKVSALRPKVLIVDEPTISYDVILQRKVLDLLCDLGPRSF